MTLPLTINPGDPGHIGDHQELHALVANLQSGDVVAGVLTGTYAALPAAGNAGRLYYATDADVLFLDTGSGWEAVGNNLQTEYVVGASGTQALTTTPTLLAGLTFNITTVIPNAVFECDISSYMSIVANGYGTGHAQVFVDGVGYPGDAALSGGTVGEDVSVTTFAQGVLASAGVHTFELRVAKTQSGGTINAVKNASKIGAKVWQGAAS